MISQFQLGEPSKLPKTRERTSNLRIRFPFLHLKSLKIGKFVRWHEKDVFLRKRKTSKVGNPKEGNSSRAYSRYLRQNRALTHGISCQRCHSHKIKCSGDQPCSKCRTVGLAEECAYATRDRQVKVSEKYASHGLLDQAV
jgi:hypothetical protein